YGRRDAASADRNHIAGSPSDRADVARVREFSGPNLAVRFCRTSLDAETRVGDLLQNPSRFDGRTLVLRGTLTRLQMHTSRKGDRYHTKEILVLTKGRPTCKTGTMVTVRGRFEHASNRVDATWSPVWSAVRVP